MKVALIGIDGATWTSLTPLIKQGLLPSFKKIIEKGAYGTLMSIIPPVTGGAWLAIATGLNPGKTGVIDFFKIKDKKTFKLVPVNSSDYQGRSLWDYLSLLDFKVAVLDYPMLTPAYPINGIMLSSWISKISTYPESLTEVIKSIAGDYNIFVDYHLEKYNDLDLFFEDLENAAIKKLKVSKYLLRFKDWNLFVDVISFTDWLQHRVWHCIDKKHPLYNSSLYDKYYKNYVKIWQYVDEYIGYVMNNMDLVFIISDHGFGPQWGVFNLAKWLEKHNLVACREPFLKKLCKNILKIGRKMKLNKITPKKVKQRVWKIEKEHLNFIPDIIFSKDKVFALKYTIPFGAIHVNPLYEKEKETIIKSLKELLESLNRELKRDLKVSIWLSRDLYHGDKLDYLPDIIFTINDWSCVVVKDYSVKWIYLDSTFSQRHTGSHRISGILAAFGDYVKHVKVDQAKLYDILPTILYVFNAPIPCTVDGRILLEIFDNEYKNNKPNPTFVKDNYYKVLKIKQKLSHMNTRLLQPYDPYHDT